jgi:hypothetical protein
MSPIERRTMMGRIRRAVDSADAEILRAVLDGPLSECGEFAFGFAAALDMVASGAIDPGDIVGTVASAWRDVNYTGCGVRGATSWLVRASRRIEGAR